MNRHIKDLKSYFNRSYLSSEDADMVLEDMDADFTIYASPDEVIDGLARNVYKGKKASVMTAISEDLSAGVDLEDTFLKYGIIDNSEYLIFSRATSVRDAVKMVILYRKEGEAFPKMASKLLLPLIIGVFVSLFIVRFVGEAMVKYFKEEIQPLMQLKSGFQPQAQFPLIMENPDFANMIIALSAGFFIVVFVLYRYVYINRPELIYKLFVIKFFDDFLRYFSIADKMRKVGSHSDEIFEFLAEKAEPKGLRALFKEMHEAGSEYALALEKFNAPQRLVSIFRRKEENSTLWDDMENHILAYAKDVRDKKASRLEIYAKLSILMGFVFVLIGVAGTVGSFVLTVWAIM